MAIPDTWSKQSEKVRWQASTGTWEVVETWKGLAGVGNATYAEWLANFTGYTSLSYDKTKPGDDYQGPMTVEIGFATNAEGDVLPPTDSSYGLIERIWEKETNKDMIPLRDSPLAAALQNVNDTWLPGIMKAAAEYNAAVRAWEKECAAAYEAVDPNRTLADGETPPDPEASVTLPLKPNKDWYVRFGIPYASGVPNQHIAITAEQWRIHRWLFNEYMLNANATYAFDVPTLRRTDTMLSVANSALWVSHVDVGRIMTYSTLAAREGSLALAVIVNASQLDGWYWIKQDPTLRQTSNGWFRLDQQYVGLKTPTENDIMRSGGEIL